MVKLLLSDVDRYFAWTATTKEGLFKFSTRKRTGSTEGYSNLELTSTLHEIFEGISTSKTKRETLLKAQNLIIENKEELQRELQEFFATKDRVLDAAEKLSRTIKTKVLSLFSPKRTLDLLFWIHEVKLIDYSRNVKNWR